ncbi:MAG TPA: cytochrome c [Candidatus Polarisedimenticolia bacterium]|nr:cytochrome c [Candidatus Polarisedimenticolia bacterium]
MTRAARAALLSLLAAAMAGCRQDMHDQPRYEPLEQSAFFPDGRSSRHLVEGTVPRGGLQADGVFATGKQDGVLAASFPMPVDRALLERGRERYDIFCSPCHDRLGTGQGMIVQRGFRVPPSMHIDRLRQAPPGHFVDVMTSGFGAMPDYRAQIPAADRWAITAYIRALQLSQHAPIESLPEEERRRLREQVP